jgi:hypothetical protein
VCGGAADRRDLDCDLDAERDLDLDAERGRSGRRRCERSARE